MEPHDAPRPLDSDAGSVPVVRPVVVAGARSAEEIRALCDAATPGPWFVASREGDDEGWWVWADRDEPFTVALLAYDGPDGTTDGERELADAAFTAAARDLVPQLLAEVEAAHRFEQSVAVEREALLREVEQLRDETARLERHRAVWQAHCEDNASVVDGLQTVVDSLRGVVQAARERDRAAFLPVAKAIHDTIGDDRCSHDALGDDCWHIARAAFVALAAAADAPQPSTEDCLSLSCGFGEHDKCPNGCDCDCHFGPSPAVLPEPKEQR